MSTHAIGTIRLVLGSLILLLVGAGAAWMVRGAASHTTLVVRGGALEIESWDGTLRPEGSDVYWDHPISAVAVSIYKAQDADQEYELSDPVPLSGVHSIRIDFRIDGSRSVEKAVVMTLEDRGVRITLNGNALLRRGDVWVHPGFVQGGRQMPFEISLLELLRQDGQVVARYQNPDMGRRFRYRVKLTGATSTN